MTNQDAQFPETANDGTPEYNETVLRSYRKLQYRISMYDEKPKPGAGIRLGIYQAQAECGEGAGEKNMKRLDSAVRQARKFDVQILSFPELYVPGYTLDPESARARCLNTRTGRVSAMRARLPKPTTWAS